MGMHSCGTDHGVLRILLDIGEILLNNVEALEGLDMR
jgi:hypothetical protein